MGVGEGGLERERLEHGGSRLRHAFAGAKIRRSREPLVRVGDGGVRERIIRIMRQGLLEVRQRLRSEEHTSELQSQSNLVCRLLLEKKKKDPRQRTCMQPQLSTTDKRHATTL